ncbi:MAG: hypothetical protein Q9217_005167, partial [Psora testacea]
TSQVTGLSQQYANNSGTAAMPPPQRPYQQLPGPSTSIPAATSTNSPPPSQYPFKPPPTPTSSMTAATPITSAQTTPTSNTSSKPTTPKASNLPQLDQDRVAALLNLNAIILRELQTLQTAGANTQPGQASPQQPNPAGVQSSTTTPSGEAQKSPTGASSTTPTSSTTTAPQTPKAIKPTPKYIFDNYLKRLQVNIAYLLALSQGKPVPPHPLAMEPPPDSWSQIEKADATETEKTELEEKGKKTAEELREAYAKLKELWPNYKPGVRPHPPPGGQQAQGQGQQPQHAQGAQGQVPVQAPVQQQQQQLTQIQKPVGS